MRLIALDELCFDQQCIELTRELLPFDETYQREQFIDLRTIIFPFGILPQSIFEIFCLTDVEDTIASIEEPIDAG